jgi:hypothetical protein
MTFSLLFLLLQAASSESKGSSAMSGEFCIYQAHALGLEA